MNYIKSHIRSLISNDEVDSAIVSLINLIVSKDFLNQCLLLRSVVNKTSKKERLNTEYSDNLRVEISQNLQSLLELVNDIPTDQEIIENRIRYAIDIEEDFSIANHIVGMCFSKELVVFSSHLNDKIENYQQVEIEYNENAGIEAFIHLVDQCSTALIDKMESLNHYSGRGVRDFISNYLEDSSFIPQFVNDYKRISEDFNNISPYFDDINSQDENVRRHLLLWEEKFLTGDYESALFKAENARLDELSTKSINYEYTLITFIKYKSLDKIISDAIKTDRQGEFEYVLLLIDRSLKLDGRSSTLCDSLLSVYYDFAQSIKKIYNNIDFSYLLNEMPRGRSRRRDYIKRLIKIYIDLVETLDVDLDKSDNLPQEILKELDGVNKFPWVEIRKGDLVNRTNFNAIDNRRKLIKILKKSEIYNPNESYTSSTDRLNRIAIKLKNNQIGSLKHKEYLNAIMVVDNLYGVHRDENLLNVSLEKRILSRSFGQEEAMKTNKLSLEKNDPSFPSALSFSETESVEHIGPSRIIEFNRDVDSTVSNNGNEDNYLLGDDPKAVSSDLDKPSEINEYLFNREKIILFLSAGIFILVLLILCYI